MSIRTAPAWLETKWKDGVTHRMQSEGFLLKPAVTPGAEVNGSTVIWRRSDAGEAQQLPETVEQVSSMNLGRDTVSAQMVDWEANDWIRKRDLEKMSINEQDAVEKSCAMAMGRRFDRIILRGLDAAGAAIPTIGTGAAAMSILDAMEAAGDLFSEGSGGYQLWAAIPQMFMSQLELFREFSSSDFVGEDYPLLKQVGARRWRNTNFIPLPQHKTDARKQFFNVPAANQADGYIWVEGAIGLESSNLLEFNCDWVATKKAWLAAMDMSAAFAVVLPEGIRRFRFATNAALTRPTP